MQELEDAKNQIDTQVLSKEDKVKDLGRQLNNILKTTRLASPCSKSFRVLKHYTNKIL